MLCSTMCVPHTHCNKCVVVVGKHVLICSLFLAGGRLCFLSSLRESVSSIYVVFLCFWFSQEGADIGAAPNSIAHEDVRAMAERKGQQKVASERLANIVHSEVDADMADGI